MCTERVPEYSDEPFLVLDGERWELMDKPEGWRNTVTGETAGFPWMELQLERRRK